MLKLALATLVGATALAAAPTPAHAQNFAPHRDARLTCASHHGQYNTCRLPEPGRVRLVHQLSDRPCVRGRTWGQRGDRRVWVSRGCRGDFAVRSDRRYYDRGVGYDHGGYDRGGYDHGGYDHGGYDHGSGDFVRDRNYAVTCRANGTRTTCAWDTRYGNPYLIDTMSGTCVEGRDWGYTSDGRIWVDEYCNARFGYRGTY
jgi:hypothetical protein